MDDADIIIVGAGLAGLRAALELSRGGLSVIVLERDECVGGRMRTDPVNGALLDRGFRLS
jgi:phytoene dehydrogenase-like protein